MINCEKLKQAVELAKKIDNQLSIEIYFPRFGEVRFILNGLSINDTFSSNGLEDVITKLIELTKPEPKFKVGDNVWVLRDGEIDSFFICSLYSSEGEACYGDPLLRDDVFWNESQLYASRNELINAQIKHWQSLKEPEEKEPDKVFRKPKINDEALQKFVNSFAYKRPEQNCVHLASPYSPIGLLEPCRQKCIKCGEFY